jgi:drug/metabolite transporter (DMT)-like permease
MLTAGLWLLNLLLDTCGQLAFKAAASDPRLDQAAQGRWLAMAARPWIWLGLFCYCAEFFTWMAFLSLVPLSHGVLLAAAGVVTVMLAGRWLFDEKLLPLRSAGIALIALGVVLVGLGGQS